MAGGTGMSVRSATRRGRVARSVLAASAVLLLALVACVLDAGTAEAGTPALTAATTIAADPAGASDTAPLLNAVACAGAEVCAAVGSYRSRDGETRALLAAGSGISWSQTTTAALPANAQSSSGNPSSTATALSCPAAGACVAVGQYYAGDTNSEGFVLSQSPGGWGPATEVALPLDAVSTDQFVQLTSVSCPAVGDCVAVGEFQSSGPGAYIVPLVVSEINGVWGAASEVAVPPAQDGTGAYGELSSVSCSSVGNCAAVGNDTTGAFTLSEHDRVWSAPVATNLPADATNADSDLTSVACPGDGECTAVGGYQNGAGSLPMRVTETGGSWGTAVAMAPPSDARATTPDSTLAQVACVSPEDCVTVGSYENDEASQGMVATESDGTWSSTEAAPLPYDADPDHASQLTQVACDEAGDCGAVGSYTRTDGISQGMVLSGTDGILSTPNTAGSPGYTGIDYGATATALGCAPSGGCVDGGAFIDNLSADSVVTAVGRSGQSFETSLLLPGDAGAPLATALSSVSCGAPGDCAAVGNYGNLTAPVVVDRTSMSWGSPAAVQLPGSDTTTGTSGGLSEVACPAAGECTAVGTYSDGHGGEEGMTESETDGVWDTAAAEVALPDGAQASSDTVRPTVTLSALSCPSADNCVAVGQYSVTQVGTGTDGGLSPLLLTETDGEWTSQTPAAPAGAVLSGNGSPAPMVLESVVCADVGDCTVVGFDDRVDENSEAITLTESDGTWGPATEITPPADAPSSTQRVTLDTVSCSAPGSCSAAGEYQAADGDELPLLATDSTGSWSAQASPLPDGAFSGPLTGGGDEPGGAVASISCPAANDCAAVGGYFDGTNTFPLLLSETSGGWNAAATVGSHVAGNTDAGSVSCPSTAECVEAGAPPDQGEFSVLSGGAWSAPTAITAVGSVTQVSCAGTGDCAAVGSVAGASPAEGALISIDAPYGTSTTSSSGATTGTPAGTSPAPTGSGTTSGTPRVAPRATTAPAVTGTLRAGDLLGIRPGSWTGSQPFSYSYRWERCARTCVLIPRATAARYRLATADIGARIRAVIAVANAAGAAASSSPPRGPVLPTTAQVRALELTLARPASTHLGTLLSGDGYRTRFSTRAVGLVELSWYQLTGHGATAASTLIAQGQTTFASGRTATLRLALTRAGRHLVGAGGRVRLTASETLHLSGARATTYVRTVLLSR